MTSCLLVIFWSHRAHPGVAGNGSASVTSNYIAAFSVSDGSHMQTGGTTTAAHGIGKHACLGEKLTHSLLRASLWPALFDGYQVEIVDGVIDGEGIGGVGVKPNFREYFGTPFGDRELWVKI
jgi:hypothetical protein